MYAFQNQQKLIFLKNKQAKLQKYQRLNSHLRFQYEKLITSHRQNNFIQKKPIFFKEYLPQQSLNLRAFKPNIQKIDQPMQHYTSKRQISQQKFSSKSYKYCVKNHNYSSEQKILKSFLHNQFLLQTCKISPIHIQIRPHTSSSGQFKELKLDKYTQLNQRVRQQQNRLKSIKDKNNQLTSRSKKDHFLEPWTLQQNLQSIKFQV